MTQDARAAGAKAGAGEGPLSGPAAWLSGTALAEYHEARAAFCGPEAGAAPPPSGSELSSAPTSVGAETVAEGGAPAAADAPPSHHRSRRVFRPRHRHRRARGGFWLVPSLIFLALGLTFAALALTGKPIRLPVWLVAEAESRINLAYEQATGDQTGGTAISLGGVILRVDDDFVPRIRLEDLRLLQPSGAALLTLPEVRFALDPEALRAGRLQLRSLRLIGARLGLLRMANGQFDIALGLGRAPRPVQGVSGLMAALVEVFTHPALADLRFIEAEALTLTVDDRMLNRIWDMGDGRLRIDNRAAELAMELSASLQGGGAAPAQATVRLITAKTSPEARMTVSVDGVAAADLAAQAAPLAWLGVLDAPISGQISSRLDAQARISELEATLSIGAGALRPVQQTEPVEFDAASLAFRFDPARDRIDLSRLSVQSASLRLEAAGHAYLPGVVAGIPKEMLAQIQVSQVTIDPAGLFEEPARFDQGALDLRLRLDPFQVDIGQLSLQDDGRRLSARGQIGATPEGWKIGVDFSLDEIGSQRLLTLWPERVVPKTRQWVADNVQQGRLFDVKAALRVAPGTEPRLSLGYQFSGADVRFLKTLPPIQDGFGYATIDGRSYTQVLHKGYVSAPEGGDIDVSGSVFAVEDITQKPARAQITLNTDGPLTATLSLLDQPPFAFLSKANRSVALGEGRARLAANLRLPLQKGNKITDVEIEAKGQILEFRSDVLVPGRLITAPRLAVEVTKAGLVIAGQGAFEGVPFEARFVQGFAPEDKGQSQITGRVPLSQAHAQRLGIALPQGFVRGEAEGAITLDLRRGEAPRLRLTSDLVGAALSIPPLGWSKGPSTKGSLDLSATLGKPFQVDRLALDAADLSAEGSLRGSEAGGLAEAVFSSVTLGAWMDAAVTLTGRGAGVAPSIAVLGGRLDLRGLDRPEGSAAGSGAGQAETGPLSVSLDRLVISEKLALTGFRAALERQGGGLAGEFSGRVNGEAPVAGRLLPAQGGSSVRLLSQDAGAVLSAAGIFPNAAGGSLDLSLQPIGRPGAYDGVLKMADIRIRKAPALAELINAISVVGLLEQMNGSGLFFSEAEAAFRLTPRAVQIGTASAVGSSLGVSLSGLYVLENGRLDLQGVVSPLYLLNGIGSLLTRKGEGLFGFNYTVTGTAKEPEVAVNPLSILTPGMFRDIFRSAPPELEPDE